jgi:hypothetical protein
MARTSKEYRAFVSLVDRLMTVPKDTVDKRIAEYQKRPPRTRASVGRNRRSHFRLRPGSRRPAINGCFRCLPR